MEIYDNKYMYIRPLGSGGFGQVFLAKEKMSHRLVAIKELHNGAGSSFDSIIREIQTVSKFNFFNHIVHIVTWFYFTGVIKLRIVLSRLSRDIFPMSYV